MVSHYSGVVRVSVYVLPKDEKALWQIEEAGLTSQMPSLQLQLKQRRRT